MRTKISDDYIAGFVDGEGCFSITIRRDVRHERKTKATYYSWKVLFAICLRIDDIEILNEIQKRFKCGSVIRAGKGTVARLQVGNITDLYTKVAPFFKENKLYGKKSKDFDLWSEAVGILYKYKALKGEGCFKKTVWADCDIKRLKEIQEISSQYKSKNSGRKWLQANLGRENMSQD